MIKKISSDALAPATTKEFFIQRKMKGDYMQDYIELGSAPSDEDCVQVSSDDSTYFEKMRVECLRYKQFLATLFPNIPKNCMFVTKKFLHDFGPYLEVVIYYETNDQASEDYALNIEGHLPRKWTDTIDIIMQSACKV